MMNANQLRLLQQMMQAQQQSDEGLVHFKAGRMEFDEGSRMVTADKKLGLLKLVRADDGVIHFQWQNRISGSIDLDVMLFSNTAVFEKVDECKDGRVFVLRMLQSGVKHFFWMQEASEEKDKEYLENVNKLCRGESLSGENNNSANNNANNNATNNASSGGGLTYEQQLQQAMLQSLQGGSNASGGEDLNQLLLRTLQGQTGNNNRRAAGGASSGNRAPATQNDQQQRPQPQAQPQQLAQLVAQAMEQQANKQRELVEKLKKEPNLTDILNSNESVNPEIKEQILLDEKVCEELAEHLPEDMKSREDILEQINSPQFRSSLERLQEVINSPNLATILAQMGLQAENEMDMGVTAFIQAIIKKYGTNNPNPNP